METYKKLQKVNLFYYFDSRVAWLTLISRFGNKTFFCFYKWEEQVRLEKSFEKN